MPNIILFAMGLCYNTSSVGNHEVNYFLAPHPLLPARRCRLCVPSASALGSLQVACYFSAVAFSPQSRSNQPQLSRRRAREITSARSNQACVQLAAGGASAQCLHTASASFQECLRITCSFSMACIRVKKNLENILTAQTYFYTHIFTNYVRINTNFSCALMFSLSLALTRVIIQLL